MKKIFNFLLPELRLSKNKGLLLEMNFGLVLFVWGILLCLIIYIINLN